MVLLILVGGGILTWRYYSEKSQEEQMTKNGELTPAIEKGTLITCGSFKILLPQTFTQLEPRKKNEDKILDKDGCYYHSGDKGCVCVRKNLNNNKGVMFMATISELELKDRLLLKNKSFYLKFLESLKKSGEMAFASDEFMDGNVAIIELFDNSALFNTVIYLPETEDDILTLTKDFIFVRNSKFYIIGFTSTEDIFNEQWENIEKSIRNIEFLD